MSTKYVKVIDELDLRCFENSVKSFINKTDINVESVQYSYAYKSYPHYSAMIIYTEKK